VIQIKFVMINMKNIRGKFEEVKLKGKAEIVKELKEEIEFLLIEHFG